MGGALRSSASSKIDGTQASRCKISFDGATVFSILNLQYDDDSYSKGLAQGIRDFVARKKAVSANDLSEWHSEFERLSEAGRYFFSTNRYIFKASKPTAHTG